MRAEQEEKLELILICKIWAVGKYRQPVFYLETEKVEKGRAGGVKFV